MRLVSGLRATGGEFPIEASISQIAVGYTTMAAVFLRDVTEQRVAESEVLYRMITDRATDLILRIDPNGVIES